MGTLYSFDGRADLPWPNSMLKVGVIVGHTTENGSRIWVRTGRAGKFSLLVFDRKVDDLKSRFSALREADGVSDELIAPFRDCLHGFEATRENDYIRVVEVGGLQANTEYSYAVLERHEGGYEFVLGHDKRRRFKTKSMSKRYAFGLFSCHNPFKDSFKVPFVSSIMGARSVPKVKNMDVWETAKAVFARPRKDSTLDFLIAGGDQVYCDGCDSVSLWKFLEKTVRDYGSGKCARLPSFEEMVSWYRNMYRGYWGFPTIRSIYGQHPTYMIWDDHELRDGWGSHRLGEGDHEINEILFDGWEKCVSEAEARGLIGNMIAAAKQAYGEYQHSHNPQTPHGQYDYQFEENRSLFYVLDGRGCRDFDRPEYKILGAEQMKRFRDTVESLKTDETKFLFVVSAVPVMHGEKFISEMAEGGVADFANITDDLRDAWEHDEHTEERRELLDVLFGAAARGISVFVLSGDVHVTAAFSMEREGHKLYQLTSSAITYSTPRMLAKILGGATEDDGDSEDGYFFKRLMMLTDPSFAVVKVNAEKGKESVTFQIYKAQKLKDGGLKGGGDRLSRNERLRGDSPEKEHLAVNSVFKLEIPC